MFSFLKMNQHAYESTKMGKGKEKVKCMLVKREQARSMATTSIVQQRARRISTQLEEAPQFESID